MKLLLERIYNCKKYCIGHLYDITSGKKKFICDTIEDTDRGLSDSMSVDEIKDIKIYCETAIPIGEYKITMNVKSPKFSKQNYYNNFCKGYLPRLIDVKGYDGILIHGNFMDKHLTNGDNANENASCGCLIVGKNTIKGKVTDCRECFELLMNDYLVPSNNNNEEITIQITRKYKL